MTKTETPIALPCEALPNTDRFLDATRNVVIEVDVYGCLPRGEAQLIRDYVLRAVNSYEAMKEALREGARLIAKEHQRNSCYCDLCKWSSKAEEIAEGRQ